MKNQIKITDGSQENLAAICMKAVGQNVPADVDPFLVAHNLKRPFANLIIFPVAEVSDMARTLSHLFD